MKVRIDTKAKTIAIEEAVNIDQLLKLVKGLFPDNWKEWKLETNVKFEMPAAPIIIREREVRPYWYGGGICATAGTGVSTSTVQFYDIQSDWSMKTQAGTSFIVTH